MDKIEIRKNMLKDLTVSLKLLKSMKNTPPFSKSKILQKQRKHSAS